MNKKGLILKLIGIMVIAIIAAACTPKKSESDVSEYKNDLILEQHHNRKHTINLEGLELYIRITRILQNGDWMQESSLIGEDGEMYVISQN